MPSYIKEWNKNNYYLEASLFFFMQRYKNTHYARHAAHPQAGHELTLVLVFCASPKEKNTDPKE